jgi:hypothetical protein
MGPHKDLEGIARALSGQPRPESGPNVPRCVPLHGRRVKRSTPLARTGRLPRRTRMAAVNKRRKGSLFPKRRDPGYCAWIRTLECCVPERGRRNWIDGGRDCAGRIECAHVRSRGAGGPDVANTVPLCTRHHREQHAIGIFTFQHRYGANLPAIASDLAERYPAARVWADHRGDE